MEVAANDIELYRQAISDPYAVKAERCRRAFSHFMREFWDEVSNDPLIWNWHLDYLCDVLQNTAVLVGNRIPKQYDIIINIPPGTTKSKTVNVMFNAWCWTRWHWMQFISASYTEPLALEQAELCRDLIRSDKFKKTFPEISIRRDKDAKGNFKLIKRSNDSKGNVKIEGGGNRFSTSVGGTVTGFHGHINIVDDPLDPRRAVSEAELKAANHWMDNTLPMRKADKKVTVTILIMQRLAQNDPTGHLLEKKKKNVKWICLPGEIWNYADKVRPPELIDNYVDGMLDPIRMDRGVLEEMEADLGQYGFAGQVGQHPTPPGGGMFKVDRFVYINQMPPPVSVIQTIRYWDKAYTEAGGAYTVGSKMHLLQTGKWLVSDVVRGQWGTDEREAVMKSTAEADGIEHGKKNVSIYIEQEPAAGKESVASSISNLKGFRAMAHPPVGDKIWRADQLSVQVNTGNVILLRGEWNYEFIEEFRFFPVSKYKDQVDATAGAFNKLMGKKRAGAVGKRKGR